jgi:DNA-directed RNA polymerase specialized sigma24 family protein
MRRLPRILLHAATAVSLVPGATSRRLRPSRPLCSYLWPSIVAARGEMWTRLAESLGTMDPTDREVLAMRHFEQLSNGEASQVLVHL